MSDDDMIRRGDAIELARKQGLLSVEGLRTIPAVQPPPDVAALVVKVIDDRIAAILADEESIMSPARQVISRWASSVISELENIRAALARLKGGAGHSLDYERKVAQMKEDFPNGI